MKKICFLILIVMILIYAITSCSCSHTFSSKITREPTCADGEKTYYCTKCGYFYTEKIPAVENHEFEKKVIVEPTIENNGKISYTCKKCFYYYTETIDTRKIRNRISQDVDSVLQNDGISPGNVFFMSYSNAISRFVKNKNTSIYTSDEAVKKGALSNSEKRSLLNNSKGLSSYNIFIYQITGKVMKNPMVEFLMTDETTVLRIALLYDNDANYVGYQVLEVNDSLNTCVIITVTR